MREITFKGKTTEDNEWVFGNMVNSNGKIYIIGDVEASNDYGEGTDLYAIEWYEVTPESVSQYTGIKGKNGKKIYEGDNFHLGDHNITYTVVWSDSGFKGIQNGTYGSYVGLQHWKERIEVVSNQLTA